MVGKIVAQGIATQNKLTVDLSAQSNSVYFLQVNNKTIKIIKQ
jgi:hypothetical protein